MPAALALILLCATARAQDASSATAVSSAAAAVSSATVTASTAAAVAVSSAPAAAAAPAPAAAARPIYVKLHKESSGWEPVSVRAGGDAEKTGNLLTRQLEKARIKGKAVWRGRRVAATAKVRVYPVKDDRMLVVSLFPKQEALSGTHFEVRLLVSEGYLDEAKVAKVRCRAPEGRGLDSFELASKGLDFSEDFPGSGQLVLSALNPKAGKRSLNAGRLSRAEFADADWGLVDAAFSVRGVTAGK